MSLGLAPGAYVLPATEGEALWFAASSRRRPATMASTSSPIPHHH